MDTIRRESLDLAVRALGFRPARVDRIEADVETLTASRTTPVDRPLAAVACQHLGFPPEDVLSFTLTAKEVTVTLMERDEHGKPLYRYSRDPHGNICPELVTRTEVCNVGA